MKNKKTCVIYCRQVSNGQNNNSINHQEITLKKIAEERGFKIEKIIKDIGTSTNIKQLIEDFEKQNINYLLVTDLDRITRDKIDAHQIFDLMERNKLERVITPNKDFDSKNDGIAFLLACIFCYSARQDMIRRMKLGKALKQR